MVDRYDEELFLEYVEGELPVEKRIAFENQMLQDPRLRNLVAQMVLDRHRMRTMPDEAPPTHMMDAVNERLERAMLLGSSPQEFNTPKKTANNGFRWRRMATMGAMAAMIAMVAGVFIVTFVQLANDTPIRNVGPGSLFPPGMLPPSIAPRNTDTQTGTLDGAGKTNTNTDINDIAGRSGTDTTDPRQSPTVAMRPTELFPKDPTTDSGTTPDTQDPSQPTAAELAAAKATAGTADPSAQPSTNTNSESTEVQAPAPLAPLPAATVIFNVRTTDLSAAQKRLTSWATAYQAKVLDTRDIKPTTLSAASKIEAAIDSAIRTTPEATPKTLADATGDFTSSADKAATAATSSTTPSEAGKAGEVEIKPIANQAIAIEPLNTDADTDADTKADTDRPAVLGVSVTLQITPDLLLPLETFLATLPGVEVERLEVEPADVEPPSQLTPRATAGQVPFLPIKHNMQSAIATNFTTEPTVFDKLLPVWFTDPTTLWPQTVAQADVKPTTAVVRVQIINSKP